MTGNNLLQDLREQWEATHGDAGREQNAKADIAGHLLAGLPGVYGHVEWVSGEQAPEDLVERAMAAASDDAAWDLVRAAVIEKGRPRDFCNVWDQTPARRTWLVDGWLATDRVALLAGEGGVGKSGLTVQLAYGIAAGEREWLAGGPRLRTGGEGQPVVLATWEDDLSEILRRLHVNPALTQAANGHRPPDASAELDRRLADRLHVLDFAGQGALWEPLSGGSGHTSTMGGITHTGRWLRAYCERHAARLLVVDPLAAAYALNENDRGLVRAFMSSWDAWARDTGCAVLLVAHKPKGDADYSGSTDWHAAARTVWTLGWKEPAKKEPEAICLRVVKSNYGPPPDALRLDGLWRRAEAWPATGNRRRTRGSGPAPRVPGT